MPTGGLKLEVQHDEATDAQATASLLRQAIGAAVPRGFPFSLIQCTVLGCLVDQGVKQQGPGRFRVDAVHIAQLGAWVRAACDKAGPEAWASFVEYEKTLKLVLNDLQGLVTCQEMAHGTAVQRQQKVAQGTTTRVLLRADTLLRVLGSSSPGPGATPKAASGSGFGGGGGFSTAPGGFNNNGNNGFSYGGFRGQEEPAETGFSLSLPTSPRKPAPEAGISPLVFELEPHVLEYQLTNKSPANVRAFVAKALPEALATAPGGGDPSSPGAVLAQAAMAAVLRASALERSATNSAELLLRSCSVQSAQRLLQAMLQRLEDPEGPTAEFQSQYGGSLRELLGRQPECEQLTIMGAALGGALHALLRVDLILGDAALLRGELPSPSMPSTPEASEAVRPGQQGAGAGAGGEWGGAEGEASGGFAAEGGFVGAAAAAEGGDANWGALPPADEASGGRGGGWGWGELPAVAPIEGGGSDAAWMAGGEGAEGGAGGFGGVKGATVFWGEQADAEEAAGGYSGGGYGGGRERGSGGGARVCRLWTDSGHCRFGDRCRFEHPPLDQLPAAGGGRGRSRGRGGRGRGGGADFYPGAEEPQQWGEGYEGRRGPEGGGRGGSGGRQLCRQWAASGSWRFGDRCRFQHPALDQTDAPAETGGDYQQGEFTSTSWGQQEPQDFGGGEGTAAEEGSYGGGGYSYGGSAGYGGDSYYGGGSYGGGRGGGGSRGSRGVCHQWEQHGSCRWGDACRFEHVALDEHEPASQPGGAVGGGGYASGSGFGGHWEGLGGWDSQAPQGLAATDQAAAATEFDTGFSTEFSQQEAAGGEEGEDGGGGTGFAPAAAGADSKWTLPATASSAGGGSQWELLPAAPAVPAYPLPGEGDSNWTFLNAQPQQSQFYEPAGTNGEGKEGQGSGGRGGRGSHGCSGGSGGREGGRREQGGGQRSNRDQTRPKHLRLCYNYRDYWACHFRNCPFAHGKEEQAQREAEWAASHSRLKELERRRMLDEHKRQEGMVAAGGGRPALWGTVGALGCGARERAEQDFLRLSDAALDAMKQHKRRTCMTSLLEMGFTSAQAEGAADAAGCQLSRAVELLTEYDAVEWLPPKPTPIPSEVLSLLTTANAMGFGLQEAEVQIQLTQGDWEAAADALQTLALDKAAEDSKLSAPTATEPADPSGADSEGGVDSGTEEDQGHWSPTAGVAAATHWAPDPDPAAAAWSTPSAAPATTGGVDWSAPASAGDPTLGGNVAAAPAPAPAAAPAGSVGAGSSWPRQGAGSTRPYAPPGFGGTHAQGSSSSGDGVAEAPAYGSSVGSPLAIPAGPEVIYFQSPGQTSGTGATVPASSAGQWSSAVATPAGNSKSDGSRRVLSAPPGFARPPLPAFAVPGTGSGVPAAASTQCPVEGELLGHLGFGP